MRWLPNPEHMKLLHQRIYEDAGGSAALYAEKIGVSVQAIRRMLNGEQHISNKAMGVSDVEPIDSNKFDRYQVARIRRADKRAKKSNQREGKGECV